MKKEINKSQGSPACKERKRVPAFLGDGLKGYFMGVAFIIPGFSGGSVAAILGVYEKLVGAIADLFTSFKKSFLTILPIFIGLCLGAVSLMYPLKWALGAFAFPTVGLFVGLALGGLPSIAEELRGRVMLTDCLSFAIPMMVAVGLCFLPIAEGRDLMSLSLGGYLLLFLIGILGSTALVVPGISGSMILLILGYYDPLLGVITENLLVGQNIGRSLLVLGSCGLGIVVGFIGISVIMKKLLAVARRGTHFAILGFIIGSLPTIFVSTAKDCGYTLSTLPTSPFYWIATVSMMVAGVCISLLLYLKAKGTHTKKAAPTAKKNAK